MTNQMEIEIKVLLGEEKTAKSLIQKITLQGYKLESTNSQLNHYFEGNNFGYLSAIDDEYFVDDMAIHKLHNILMVGSSFSIRTRQLDDKVYLVVKASVDGTTSSNGISRLEFEEEVKLSLDVLDKFLNSIGFKYQAKWSRQRAEYVKDEIKVCLDKNAGYGYLAEFEKIVDPSTNPETVQKELRELVASFGLQELSQERLKRMFEYYNENWREYYGTQNVFSVE
jgi:predicted adenylyl cyclase CyaB